MSLTRSVSVAFHLIINANAAPKFAYAAEFCYRTGFNGVQLHGAHGYLLAQFLSSTTNRRTDEYGGSLQNRARIIYEIVEEIRRRVPDPKFSIGIKINSVEFQEGGFQPEECRDVCAHLEELSVDFVELSGGSYESLAFVHKRESSKKREGNCGSPIASASNALTCII